MDIKRVSISTHGPCSFCKRGKVNGDCSGLDYPYTEVTEILGALVNVRVCDHCLVELKNIDLDREVEIEQ